MKLCNKTFSDALLEQQVVGEVVDIDYQRGFGVLALGPVDTRFVIQVRPSISSSHPPPRRGFKPFRIGKSYKDFRNLVAEFKEAAKVALKNKKNEWNGVSESAKCLIACSDALVHVVDTEPISHFIGKMSYSHVQYLAFERRKIINHAIRIILENYPDNTWAGDGKQADVAPITTFRRIVTAFFLTDHLVDPEGDDASETAYFGPQVMYSSHPSSDHNLTIDPSRSIEQNPSIDDDPAVVMSFDEEKVPKRQESESEELTTEKEDSSNGEEPRDVVPMSSQRRQSTMSRREMEKQMKYSAKANLLENPIMLAFLFFMTMQFFIIVPTVMIHVGSDVVFVVLFAVFMIGRKTANCGSEDMELVSDDGVVNTRHAMEQDSARLLRRTLAYTDRSSAVGNDFSTPKEESPFKKFPDGAPIGSMQNCWSEPIFTEFRVRGKDYLTDRLKVTSGPFMFPLRGVDMFLSDCCPEHIARYKALLGGKLREVPTFLINYRLPWGVLVCYHEIPNKFLPFLRHCYEPDSTAPSMEGMTPQEICICRFFMESEKKKNRRLKIVPQVVKGPWIVKKTADGKPAIIGSKMPTQFFYSPPNPDLGQSEYLEVDLDIVASSAARGILAVAQRYTKTLTLDLGFVIQGNTSDELPEQMLLGTRIHGLDPVQALALPEAMY